MRINIQPTVILLSTRLDESVDALLQSGHEGTDLHSNAGWSSDEQHMLVISKDGLTLRDIDKETMSICHMFLTDGHLLSSIMKLERINL